MTLNTSWGSFITVLHPTGWVKYFKLGSFTYFLTEVWYVQRRRKWMLLCLLTKWSRSDQCVHLLAPCVMWNKLGTYIPPPQMMRLLIWAHSLVCFHSWPLEGDKVQACVGWLVNSEDSSPHYVKDSLVKVINTHLDGYLGLVLTLNWSSV